MKKYIKYFVCMAAGLLLILCTRFMNSNTLIIWFGISTVKILRVLFNIAGVLLIILGIIGLIRHIAKTAKREKKIPKVEMRNDSGYNSGFITSELEKRSRTVKGLDKEIAILMEQTRSMDRKEAKIDEIIERNQTTSLKDVRNTLLNVEQDIFNNIVKVLNRIDLWDNNEYHLPGKQEIYKEHRERIGILINKNNEILDITDKLLSETIRYLNTKDSNEDYGMHLNAMLETMKTLSDINEK